MITLTGTLRQCGEVKFKEKEMVKLWVEHETPRDNGVGDLKIEEFFLPKTEVPTLPKKGEEISVVVRPYPSGRGVAFQAIRVASNGQTETTSGL